MRMIVIIMMIVMIIIIIPQNKTGNNKGIYNVFKPFWTLSELTQHTAPGIGDFRA